MATVTIILTDEDTGHVTVNIAGLAADGEIPTKAQAFGSALNTAIDELPPCVCGMGRKVCWYCDGNCVKRNGR